MTEPAAQAFDDSRRLPGPNRWFAGPAVVLTALSSATHDDSALAAWGRRVRALCAALDWPDPQPLSQRRALGATLAFAAPACALFTATEINEWAWERSAAEVGALQAISSLNSAVTTQPASDDIAWLGAHFAALAARESAPPLARLRAAAAVHGVPVFDDDDTLSLGAGSGSHSWPRAALPLALDVLWPQLHDIPTVLVTGSNGKTTTTRLLAAMAQAAGFCAGLCSTEGIVVAGQRVLDGDYAGPAGARAVLRHPGVNFAVLEAARGGLLRRGLAVQRAIAAVVTNISADHLGEYGVDSVEDIAETKLVLARAVAHSGSLVLNGGDALLMAVARRTHMVQSIAADGRLALFAQDIDHPALQDLRRSGGATCGLRTGRLMVTLGAALHDLGAIADMPLTLDGAAGFQAENIAAAVLAALAADMPLQAIRDTLASFGSRPEHNAGRLERWPWRGATVLIDYAHNPDGLAKLLRVAQSLRPVRLGLLLGQAGNRDDGAIAQLARTAAGFMPDRVWIKELPGMLRGRALGQVPALLESALRAAGLPQGCMAHEGEDGDETAAALAMLDWAQPGDVLVLPVHTGAVRARLAAVLAG